MPDLIGHWTRTCSSNTFWQATVPGTGKTHTVTWGIMPPQHPTQYDWSCTCDAYKFGRGRPCKHIKQVDASKARCAWNETLDLVELVATCPCCGANTEPVQVAV